MPVAASRVSAADLARNLDLLALAIALPVFIALDAPIAGYLAAGGAWVVGRIGKHYADQRRGEAMAAANRSAALGLTAFAMLGRLWLLAGVILIVGLIAGEDAGLAGALLAAALVTAHLIGEGLAQVGSGGRA